MFSPTVGKSKCSYALSEKSYFYDLENPGHSGSQTKFCGPKPFKTPNIGTVPEKLGRMGSLSKTAVCAMVCRNDHNTWRRRDRNILGVAMGLVWPATSFTLPHSDHWAPHCPPRRYDWKVIWTILLTVPISRPVIFNYLDPLRNTWLENVLQLTPTWSNLSPPGYRHLTPIASTPRCKPCCHGGTMLRCQWRLCWGPMCTIYSLRAMYTSQNKHLASMCSLPYDLKLFCSYISFFKAPSVSDTNVRVGFWIIGRMYFSWNPNVLPSIYLHK
jgi:hypothetical protein